VTLGTGNNIRAAMVELGRRDFDGGVEVVSR